jgi:hypothetical protein
MAQPDGPDHLVLGFRQDDRPWACSERRQAVGFVCGQRARVGEQPIRRDDPRKGADEGIWLHALKTL